MIFNKNIILIYSRGSARASAGSKPPRRWRKLRSTSAVIDRQNHHCFQPLLYQVATAALSPADVAWPIRHILRRQQNATVLMAEVTGVDTAETVRTDQAGRSPTTILVLATGATHSYFGHDEWADVRARPQAHRGRDRIRRSILLAFEQAELDRDAAERQRLLTFVIVGGGADRRRNGRRHRRDRAADARQGFPPHRSARRAHHPDRGRARASCRPCRRTLSDYAGARCRRMGVEVKTSTRV